MPAGLWFVCPIVIGRSYLSMIVPFLTFWKISIYVQAKLISRRLFALLGMKTGSRPGSQLDSDRRFLTRLNHFGALQRKPLQMQLSQTTDYHCPRSYFKAQQILIQLEKVRDEVQRIVVMKTISVSLHSWELAGFQNVTSFSLS